MADSVSKNSSREVWTSIQVYALAAVCLLVGIAAGWLSRGSQVPPTVAAQTATAAIPIPPDLSAQASSQQTQSTADQQAAPLLAQLKTNPQNAELLASLGNVYYDSGQYQTAIEYYQRALRITPDNANVRTDLGTAYWYTGDSDTAIAEYQKALSSVPNQANALFNMGIVKWRGKKDANGAIAAWQKLLDTNPNYENRDKVLQLMTEARQR
jgi:cytochrome c-type biogenesis protein CcmH/NrfG